MAISKITTNSITDDAVTTAKVNPAQTDITSVGTLSGLTVSGDATLTGDNYNVVWDKSDNALEFGDNAKLKIGTGDDLQISHNGTNSLIANSTGALLISGDDIAMNSSGGESMFSALSNGNVRLYYDNAEKFQTTTTGISVGGTTAETHHSSMKSIQVGARGFLLPYDSGAVYLTSNVFYSTSNSWQYASNGGGNVLSLNNGTLYYYHVQNGNNDAAATLIERFAIVNNNSNNDNYTIFYSTRNSVAHYFVNKHASAPYGLYIQFDSAAPDNNDSYFLRCVDSSATRMTIFSDGDVNTSDAGTLSSDSKNKNTITDATDKWDDIKKLQVRNFYWNEAYHPNKKDKKMIGFIAQEFETVFPGLVTEIKDEETVEVKQEDGTTNKVTKDLGTTTKAIREGKLIPILTKALQEAMTRIETLEAKVKTLEEA